MRKDEEEGGRGLEKEKIEYERTRNKNRKGRRETNLEHKTEKLGLAKNTTGHYN